MPAPLLKLALALTSAPVMVAIAFAWGSPAMAALPTAVPGPLPVLGALSAFGFSRKLRQRIVRGQVNSSRIG